MKSNVTNITNIRAGSKGREPARPGARPELLSESDVIGWLIYRPDTEEFLYSHKAGVGYSSEGYVKEPALAYLFDSERLAYRYSTFIDKETEVVPFFDIGDKLAVGFR